MGRALFALALAALVLGSSGCSSSSGSSETKTVTGNRIPKGAGPKPAAPPEKPNAG
jgi:hypothetical protein